MFWIGNHFEADIRHNFADTLSKAIEQGYTKEMLADTLKDQFNDLANRSSHYWQGLAEHTALRIREFGRLQGYKKAKARYYKLVVILDDRTSDICRALAAQDKTYPLNVDTWTDKETGKSLTVAEIAYLIRGKIKRYIYLQKSRRAGGKIPLHPHLVVSS